MLATQLTPNGEVPVRTNDKGKVIERLPIPVVKMTELPKGFTPKHSNAVYAMKALIEEIENKNREVPALREELEQYGVTKKLIKELEDMQFVKSRITPLIYKNSGQRKEARAVVLPTAIFHAYLVFMEESKK